MKEGRWVAQPQYKVVSMLMFFSLILGAGLFSIYLSGFYGFLLGIGIGGGFYPILSLIVEEPKSYIWMKEEK